MEYGSPANMAFQKEMMGGIGQAQALQPTRDASQMEIAAKRHAQVLMHLTEQIKQLSDRLHPVLRPAAPTPSSGQGQLKSPEPLAPVPAALHQISDEVEHLNAIVGDILNRLEI